MNYEKNGISAHIQELDNGNYKVTVEGHEGSKQFTDLKEAKKFIDCQFEKACA